MGRAADDVFPPGRWGMETRRARAESVGCTEDGRLSRPSSSPAPPHSSSRCCLPRGFPIRCRTSRSTRTAAARARGAEPLYRAEDGHYQFEYLPAFAVLTSPGARVSLETAKAVWFVASVALLVALVSLSLAMLPERRKAEWVLVTLTVVVMLKFYGHELVLGQMNALFAVLVAAAAVSLKADREAAAGGLIALAIVVKPYAVIFLPWVLARRRTAAIAAAAAGAVMLIALPALVYGVQGDIDLHLAWWKTVTQSTAPNLTNADNVSIAAMSAKWIGMGLAATVLTAVTSAILLGTAIFVFVRRRTVALPEGLEAAFLLTCIPLLSPQGWDYVFLVSTPAIMFLVNYEDRLPAFTRFTAIAALATIGLERVRPANRTRLPTAHSWRSLSSPSATSSSSGLYARC